MAFFRKKTERGKREPGEASRDAAEAAPPAEEEVVGEDVTDVLADEDRSDSAEGLRSPQEVGIVSGVLTVSDESDAGSGFGDVVARRFGPAQPDRAPVLRAVEPLFPEDPATPDLEVDPMAHIGNSTTITGNIAAEEDLEIQGTVEGTVRLIDHQLTVGTEGIVKADVEANTILVQGRVNGDVNASDLVEVKAGGIIGGDVRAPRVIMHDGAIVIGSLDMSAALPSSAEATSDPSGPVVVPSPPADTARPQLQWVDGSDPSSPEEPAP